MLSVLAWTIVWYWETASSMAQIWWRSETFAHGMVVYPISIWLVWRKRKELKGLPSGPSWIAICAMAVVGFGWLLGELAGVDAARHLGLAMMIACSVWAVLGTPIARAISFPLAFSLLAVPVGEFLLPVLIQNTADFTVGALRLTGIPVYREGNDFVLSTGSWSVVEACSGLRYLIASLTLGLLYAYLTYTSLLRRVLFVAASIAVPIVANWVRAYLIVMIGHVSGMKYAVGVDHLIYGWLFFGAVMLVMFWIGSFWREDPVRGTHATPSGASAGELTPGFVAGSLIAAAIVTAAPLYAQALDAGSSDVHVTVPAADPANGWTPKAPRQASFRPNYSGARGVLEQTFEKDGRTVGIFVAYYARERHDSGLIMSSNTVRPSGERSWVVTSEGRVQGAAQATAAVETRLRSESSELLVWHWYWADDRWVVRPEIVKVLQAFSRLFGNGDDAAVVVLYTTARGDGTAARETLRQFHTEMAPSLRAILRQARATSHASQAGNNTRLP
jgi:exosortase A